MLDAPMELGTLDKFNINHDSASINPQAEVKLAHNSVPFPDMVAGPFIPFGPV